MTAPLRRYLLNRQIAIESRRIACAATKTCKGGNNDDKDDHTKNCNTLKLQIETLVLNVKLASMQAAQAADNQRTKDDGSQHATGTPGSSDL